MKQVQWTVACTGVILVCLANVASGETCEGDNLAVPDAAGLAATRSLAVSGDAFAQAQMAAAYLVGKVVRKDPVEERLWLGRSAAGGNIEGQHRLGVHYVVNGKSDEDFIAAASWLRKAADRGCVHSSTYLGLLLQHGKGVPKNPEEGFRLLSIAAEAGHTVAQILVGTTLIEGKGASKDPKTGFQWIERAANAGDSAAAILLATLYLEGTGTAKEPEKTRNILEAVYLRGDEQAPKAAYYLGWMYMEGKGIVVDNVKAFRWMVIAANAKVFDSESRLKTLIDQLPKQRLATACTVYLNASYSGTGVEQAVQVEEGEAVVSLSVSERFVEVFFLDRSLLGFVWPQCLK